MGTAGDAIGWHDPAEQPDRAESEAAVMALAQLQAGCAGCKRGRAPRQSPILLFVNVVNVGMNIERGRAADSGTLSLGAVAVSLSPLPL